MSTKKKNKHTINRDEMPATKADVDDARSDAYQAMAAARRTRHHEVQAAITTLQKFLDDFQYGKL